eukprot:gene4036-14115_t
MCVHISCHIYPGQLFKLLSENNIAVSSLVLLCLDHSMEWYARLMAAALLAQLLVQGGSIAETVAGCGAFLALIEFMDRESFPFYRQDRRSAKTEVVRAFGFIAADEALRQHIADTTPSRLDRTYSIALPDGDSVLRAILKALWTLVNEAHLSMVLERTARGKHMNPIHVAPLLETSTAAAQQLNELADSTPDARRMMSEMGFNKKMSVAFMKNLADVELHAAMSDLKAKLRAD